MGLQKYRADEAGWMQKNGSTPWYAKWNGGPSIALVRNCPTPFGQRTVYVTGEADTFWTQPAVCLYKGKRVKGYLSCDEDGWKFIIPCCDHCHCNHQTGHCICDVVEGNKSWPVEPHPYKRN